MSSKFYYICPRCYDVYSYPKTICTNCYFATAEKRNVGSWQVETMEKGFTYEKIKAEKCFFCGGDRITFKGLSQCMGTCGRNIYEPGIWIDKNMTAGRVIAKGDLETIKEKKFFTIHLVEVMIFEYFDPILKKSQYLVWYPLPLPEIK